MHMNKKQKNFFFEEGVKLDLIALVERRREKMEWLAKLIMHI